MRKQPDLHYDGVITVDYLRGLTRDLDAALTDLNTSQEGIAFRDCDESPEPASQPCVCVAVCMDRWRSGMQYARLRIEDVLRNAGNGKVTKSDHKCVDISLCVLRDYRQARALGFVETTHV